MAVEHAIPLVTDVKCAKLLIKVCVREGEGREGGRGEEQREGGGGEREGRR